MERESKISDHEESQPNKNISQSNVDQSEAFICPREEININFSQIKVYRKRWLILAMYVLYATGSFMQWFQYSIISNTVAKYYSVSAWSVNLTSLIFMLTYLPLAFPVSYLMDKMDLRAAALIGVFGTALGSWIKVFSVHPTRFSVTFAGQSVIAISQLFIINNPPKVAAVWFGENEVSTACSIAIFGSQLGIASGFFLSPLLVKNSEDITVIGQDLYVMFISFALFTTAMAFIVTLFFEAKPTQPPSPAQLRQLQMTSRKSLNYITSLKRLLRGNTSFLLLVLSNGINNGCFSAMSTILTQIFIFYFPNGEQNPGTIGVIIVISGMIGSVTCGAILDKTKKYKSVAFWVYFLAIVSMVGYTFTLLSPYTYDTCILAALLGFFLLGYTPVGYEFASELTYPESEVTVATILNTMNMLAGILLTIIFDWVLSLYGEFWANIATALSLTVGTALTAMIKEDLKRQNAQSIVLN